MRKQIAQNASYFTFIIMVLAGKVASRHLHSGAAELVSDGVSDSTDAREEESVLRLKGLDFSEERCELMYGFLPCSSNIPSHFFLIVIYEYLLYHGESYAGGDGRIFRVLGKNFTVKMLSQLLDSLPDSLILLVSGLWSSEERAQDYVVTGAGLLAGSSILLLSVLWGVCFLFGRRNFYVKPDDKGKHPVTQLLTSSGVLTDKETRYHAQVIFYSLIPFVVILLPSVFGLPYTSKGYEIVLLVSLCVSVICLFSYFYSQRSDPWIQKRRLDYAEVEQKVEMHVPFYEVQNLILEREKIRMVKQKEMEKELKNLENDNPETMDQFRDKYKKWLDNMTQFLGDPYLLDKSEMEYSQVEELLLEERNKMMEHISRMMDPYSEQTLPNKDGAHIEWVIDRLFGDIDYNKDGSILRIELENYIMKINDQEIIIDDNVADIIVKHLDIDSNGIIDKEEFKSGIKKWITSYNRQKQSQDSKHNTDKYYRDEANAKNKEKVKAVILLVAGIFMLIFLAEPLVESVRKFSKSVNIEPFYVSFILVPMATNARTAIAAIRAAKQRRHLTTSYTFSEIYHKVFMNNILGFSVLVSVIYFRQLTWHYSAEILVLIIVCIIMGVLASSRSKFPNWTLIIAFPLYPLSLLVVYLVNDAFQFT